MRCLHIRSVLLLFCLIPGLFAAPKSTDSDSSAEPTSSNSSDDDDSRTSSTPSSTPSHHNSTITRPHVLSTKTATHITIYRPPIITPSHTAPPAPPPTHIRPPHPPPSPHQPTVAIVFEVLGGLAGFAVILSLFRCLYSYKKTPRRDRIESFVHRHQIQREMEELERNQTIFRQTSLREPPPPPYIPRPPSYVEGQASTPSSPTGPAGYTQVGAHSPPSSPPNPATDLPNR